MANVTTPRQECRRYCTAPLDAWGWGRPGDVRRCDHGRLMLGYQVAGSIPAYWRRLRPLLNPILFWRARRALRTEETRQPEPPPNRSWVTTEMIRENPRPPARPTPLPNPTVTEETRNR